MSARILGVEDDPRVLSVLERGLRLAGHVPTLTPDIASGRADWMTHTFDSCSWT